MNLTLLNGLSGKQAQAEFLRCCLCRRWACLMTEQRPFTGPEDLFVKAESIWRALSPDDWLEAFKGHAKIGQDLQSLRAQSQWSAGEQAGVHGASASTLEQLQEGNIAYEKKFGYIFIVCATGKSASEMLAALKQRLKNSYEMELKIAAGEQEKITRIRLEKLLHE